MKNKNRLEGIVNMSKITGVPLRSLTMYYERQVFRMACKITGDCTHPLRFYFEWMFTFVPEAIRLCNKYN